MRQSMIKNTVIETLNLKQQTEIERQIRLLYACFVSLSVTGLQLFVNGWSVNASIGYNA